MKAIINARIVTEDTVVEQGWLLYDSKIRAFGSGDLPAGPEAEAAMDAGNQLLLPGMIDIHVHGGAGADVMDADPQSLKRLGAHLASHGVTRYLPTTVTASRQDIGRALNTVRHACGQETGGALPLGAHLEGPFISAEKKGAQNAAYITPPDLELIKTYADVLRIVTLAPETDPQATFIEAVSRAFPHIVLSAGHTAATYLTSVRAIMKGIRSATHFFNGMPPLHHRDLSITAALLESDVYCELIADNIHVNPYWYRMLGSIKGYDRIILVSDAMSAAGLGDIETSLGGLDVTVRDGQARLKDGGSLAGSVLTLDRALSNVAAETDMDLPQLVRLATLNPAVLLGIDKDFGSITRGKTADFIICDDQFTVHRTVISGRTAFDSGLWPED